MEFFPGELPTFRTCIRSTGLHHISALLSDSYGRDFSPCLSWCGRVLVPTRNAFTPGIRHAKAVPHSTESMSHH